MEELSCSPIFYTKGEESRSEIMSGHSDDAADSDVLVKVEEPVTAVSSSVTNTQLTRPHLQLSSDPGWSQRGSSCLPRSHSVPSLSQISCAENKTFRPSQSLPDMLLKSSFEGFTPDITVDEDDESYRFLCSCPGLYQCSVTGLVFHMEGEGDVVYRIVSWDRRLLAQHHKKPAGPLFDIKCLQQSVCRLHLPHCEIPSTAGCPFLSVAHLNDEGIEFIPPHKITETHVIINISGFSGYGNVKDEDSPPEPVRALVLLFYRPPNDQDLESLLNVLMLPGNVVLSDVRRTRKKHVGDELYIETSPYCELLPGQEYTLSTCPEDDSVLVQPTTTKFHSDNYDNYFTSFQVDLEKILKHIKVFLRDPNRHSVWERRVCLSSAGLTKSCRQSALNLPSHEKLFDIRSSFIEGISGPVLKSLLDKLFEKKVLTDSERESADEMQNKRDKARFVIDTVRMKGEAASSEMIEFLCEVDPFLCEHLGLI
ncbi:NACHT, LRR and PYD domains-containing protein 1b allele 2-like [Sparus aurata]|uniref:NACHT, LRR and PYD domains-containing protein 1b allele 2-like n=1 Tax=Sparus aurata TaxID=8175 RepID=UPI0011C1D119|nr:NACHT, LRR and PYD domains-containing protein 1b allele 2-like [Sparus aurata]